MPIQPGDFEFIRDLAKRGAAIVLEPGKEYLVESRLTPVAHKEGLAGLSELVAKLRAAGASGPLHEKVLHALTTNETFFFRDFHPFDTLRKHLLPKLIEQKQGERKLSFWSAACSTGQEPYTLAIILWEYFPQISGDRKSTRLNSSHSSVSRMPSSA
mgnify:CR=1 FL=1